jgi:serine/threonine protein kinase
VLGLLSGHFSVMGRSPLGKGAFGCVWKVQERMENSPKAIKIVSKNAMERLGSVNGQDAMMNEVRVHRTVQHPCIVNLFAVHDLTSSVALVLELCCGGDLLQIICRERALRSNGGLSENGARNVTCQLLSALAHLHERHIVHRDVKCENILQLEGSDILPEDATFKLGDFGLSARLKSSQKLVERVGSPSTCAPEVIAGKPYAEPADLWSAGATLYTCLLARRMQSRSHPSLGAESLANGPASLFWQLTLHETTARPTAQEALMHAWLQ